MTFLTLATVSGREGRKKEKSNALSKKKPQHEGRGFVMGIRLLDEGLIRGRGSELKIVAKPQIFPFFSKFPPLGGGVFTDFFENKSHNVKN